MVERAWRVLHESPQMSGEDLLRAAHTEKTALGRVVLSLMDARSFEELMCIVAAPEYERFEGRYEVQLAETAARKRLEAEAATFAANDVARRLAEESARVWQERYETLAGECRRLTLSAGENAVEFFRALAKVRQLLLER